MKRIQFLFLTTILLSSCEDLLFEPDGKSNDPFTNFDYLWNEVDKKYSYFDLKRVDWDKIKMDYRSKISKGMSEDDLFKVMGDMLSELKDDHSNLISPFNISRYNIALKYESNFNYRTIEEMMPEIPHIL